MPLVGDGVAQPFRDASGSATDLAEAGTALSGAVDTLATIVALVLWVLPVLLVVLAWIVPRLRFADLVGRQGGQRPVRKVAELAVGAGHARNPVARGDHLQEPRHRHPRDPKHDLRRRRLPGAV